MESFIFKEKFFEKGWLRLYGFILLGTFSMSLGYALFISPYKIVPGGIYGIAIMLHHTLDLPMGLTALAFNIPLTIVGVRLLGPRFGIKTVLGFVLTAIFIDLINYFTQGAKLVEGDALLSAVFGGVLVGVGVGFIFKAKATVGGSDVIAMILSKYTHWPLSQLMVIVDSSIVLLGLFVFQDWKIPLYSWLVIFIMGKAIDVVIQGINYDKSLFIVSDKCDEIREKLIGEMRRGGTILRATGMFNMEERNVIFTNVNRREVQMLKDYIKFIDPDAFITVINANEIFGQGFKSLNDSD